MSSNMRSTNVLNAMCLALVLGCMLMPSVGEAQFHQPNRGHAFAWDYPVHWVESFKVVRFELRVDGGSPSSVEMSVLAGELRSYSTPLLAMPNGQHKVEVRACDLTTCGSWSEPMLFVFSPPFVVQIQRRFGWPGDLASVGLTPYHRP